LSFPVEASSLFMGTVAVGREGVSAWTGWIVYIVSVPDIPCTICNTVFNITSVPPILWGIKL